VNSVLFKIKKKDTTNHKGFLRCLLFKTKIENKYIIKKSFFIGYTLCLKIQKSLPGNEKKTIFTNPFVLLFFIEKNL
jgi:hypothetical protein